MVDKTGLISWHANKYRFRWPTRADRVGVRAEGGNPPGERPIPPGQSDGYATTTTIQGFVEVAIGQQRPGGYPPVRPAQGFHLQGPAGLPSGAADPSSGTVWERIDRQSAANFVCRRPWAVSSFPPIRPPLPPFRGLEVTGHVCVEPLTGRFMTSLSLIAHEYRSMLQAQGLADLLRQACHRCITFRRGP